MTQQVYGFNPATGRVEHHYVDKGPQSAYGHGRPVKSTGGSKQSVIRGAS